jgi:cytochrome c5
MSTIVFVLVFVGLGLGVLLVAMSGGPGGLGSVLHSQSRGSRRNATFAFFIVFVVLGVVIPGGVIALVDNNKDIPNAGVTNLTSAEKHGQELFGRRCSFCHSLKASNSVARVGPDLDQLAPSEKLVLATIKSGQSNGNGQMPAQIYTGSDAADVAAYVAKAVGSNTSGG